MNSESKGRVWRLGAGLAIVGFAAVVAWSLRAPLVASDSSTGGPVAPLASDVSAVAEVAASSVARPTKRTNPYAGVALPPPGLPANEIVAGLLLRAQAGDTRAACRLGAELIRCSRQLGNFKNLTTTPLGQRMIEDMEKNDATLSKEQADMALELLASVKTCTGVDDALIAQGPKWLRIAALAGENDALVLYADGLGMQPGTGSPYSFIRDPGFDQWRRDAQPMMWQALRQGSPDAVLALDLAYSGDNSAFGALVEDDPAQARVLHRLFQAVYGTTRRLDPRVNVAAQADADTQAEELFAQHFHSRPSPPNRGYNVWSAISPPSRFNGSEKHGACDDKPAAFGTYR